MKKSWILASLLAAGLAAQGAQAATIILDLTTTAQSDLANNCQNLGGEKGCLDDGEPLPLAD